MQKLLGLLCLTLMSWNAFATTTMDVSPQQPVVIDSNLQLPDGTTITGPWFSTKYSFASDETVTIVSLHFVITSGTQTQTADVALGTGFEVGPNTSVSTSDVYVGNLIPATNGGYSVQVTAEGWVGDANTPKAKLEVTQNFVTQ